jgi:D-glucosaminate-6-phosphate ammonia-lyase
MRRQSNENVYERLGVRTIVNASGPSTRLSGGILRPEVAAAMAEASQWCVDLAELQARASEVLADATGAESGYVTAGAAAGLMLAAAACVAKLDPARMNRLPDTAGMQNEIIIARSQRNMYDHAVVQAGAKLVEIGIPDRFSGAGVRDTQAWEYEAAANERTAAILWVAQPHSEPKLPDVVSVARRRGLPIIVDAADNCPRPRT